MEQFNLCNVVFHFKLSKEEKERCLKRFRSEAGKPYTVKFYHNFCVIKEGKISFIFFFTSGHINCTGTRSIKVIKETLYCIKRIFRVRIKGKKIRISNSTWTGNCGKGEVDILSLADGSVDTPAHWTVSLRPSSFPAALIRQRQGPSGILFKNGKIIIVGCVKKKPARDLYEEIKRIVPTLCPK